MQTVLPAALVSKWSSWIRRATFRKVVLRRVRLGCGEIMNFRSADFNLRCVAGRIWVTVGDGRRDLVLSSGDAIRGRRRSTVVVEALEDAIFEING